MADHHNLTDAFDFIDRTKEINSIETLVSEFQALIESHGFQAYCVGNATAPKLAIEDRVWSATWPKGWTAVWEQKNFASIDPVVYQLLAARLPFKWRDVRRRAAPSGIEVMDTAGEFKLNDGLGIPLIARNGDQIGVTISGEQYDLSERQQMSLHMAAIYFQARLEKLREKLPQPATRDSKSLSPRELDCLAWIAAGKTDWEISQILCIGEETVTSYVKAALKKLNALHRAQAVATAIVNHMIAP